MKLSDLMPIYQRCHLHFIFYHSQASATKEAECSHAVGFQASTSAILPVEWLMAHCHTGSNISQSRKCMQYLLWRCCTSSWPILAGVCSASGK